MRERYRGGQDADLIGDIDEIKRLSLYHIGHRVGS